ncbi:putative signaling protein [Actinoplanes sp. SE50]|nr:MULTISPECIES: EAL domain-containing protein [unclassified Actinoplanes]AEV83666.1 putative signaling protein [Actinoplanes sp. SE50/110]ATO82190.1 putative signaling protein [Actinoplanes sp. SE50]SLL99597.1 signaling protein [Actinoplanes sp. SE50/110]
MPRTVLASTALALSAIVVFAAILAGWHVPPVLLWLPAAPSCMIPMVIAARITRISGFPRPTRMFWGHLAACTVLSAVGSVCNAVDALGHGAPTQEMSPWTVAAYGGCVVALMAGMFRLPMGSTGSGDRLRIGLDAGTVLLAASIFMWQFQRTGSPVVIGFTMVLQLVTIFAIAKVALAGHHYIARNALRLFALGLFGGVLIGASQRFIADRPELNMGPLGVPLIMVLATAAAEVQRNSCPSRAGLRVGGRRPFSVLPYLAVVAIDGLLVATCWPHPRERLVVLGAVALTAVVMWRQITAMRENTGLVARLDHNSTHDALTGLPNRALFNARLAGGEAGQPVSVALIDLDDFKTVNDTLGHGAGDALLTTTARRLRASVREVDTVARLGGDEFVVLMPGLTAAEAEPVARRMIGSLAEPVLAEGHDLLVRASIGIADGPGDEPGELLRRADIAMYAAKHEGGGTVRVYTAGMAGAVADTAALGAQLRQAIAGGQLRLEYQPIVALDGSHLTGVEALVRWQHPQRGMIPPGEFIPVAERTGLIVPLGEWVLRTACEQHAAWRTELGPDAPARMNVNVSARQLSEGDFLERVVHILAVTGMPAELLTLEITESTAVALGEESTGKLEALRRTGIRIALDDFGTGQSSLTLLHELPVDQLKLDRSFVEATQGRRLNMPAAVFALAGAAGLDIVAEGVETPEQADRLAALGYRAAQGFHFARPMPADQLVNSCRRPEMSSAVAAR